MTEFMKNPKDNSRLGGQNYYEPISRSPVSPQANGRLGWAHPIQHLLYWFMSTRPR